MVFTRLVKWIFRDVYFKMFLIQNYRGRGIVVVLLLVVVVMVVVVVIVLVVVITI